MLLYTNLQIYWLYIDENYYVLFINVANISSRNVLYSCLKPNEADWYCKSGISGAMFVAAHAAAQSASNQYPTEFGSL